MSTMKKPFIRMSALIALILIMSILLAACGSNNAGNASQGTQSAASGQAANAGKGTNAENSSTDSGTANKASQPAFPITVKDDTGNEITIEKEPAKIASLMPSNTEIAFALGLGDKVVGVSDYDNYPAAVKSIQKIGSQDFNAETILNLMPDVLLISPSQEKAHADILKQFTDAGIHVIDVPDATSFAQAYKDMRLIAKVTGTSDKAEAIIGSMQQKLAAIEAKAKTIKNPKRVYIEVSPAPDIFTAGSNTFMNEMLQDINAVNVASDLKDWPKLTEEQAVKYNPDVIITTYGYYVKDAVPNLLKRAGWADVPAVKNKQVFDVNSDIVDRPGPRLIDGVEELAKNIYPETFGQ